MEVLIILSDDFFQSLRALLKKISLSISVMRVLAVELSLGSPEINHRKALEF
jgi:hypothetical protein